MKLKNSELKMIYAGASAGWIAAAIVTGVSFYSWNIRWLY